MIAITTHDEVELNSVSLAKLKEVIPLLSRSDKEIEKTSTIIAILLVALFCF